MTKTLKFGAVIATFIVLASANAAFAQQLVTTPVDKITDTPVKTIPVTTLVTPLAPVSTTTADPSATPVTTTTTDTPQPFSREAQPVVTTQEPATTTTPSTNTTTTKPTQETTETLNLPDPILPVLDASSSDTQVGTQATEETSSTGGASPDCINPDDAKATILPPVLGNQVKVALMALLGAILGAILWVLASALISTARDRGEILRIQNRGRQEMDTRRTETLAESKAALSDALSGIIKQTGAKSSIDHAKFEEYARAAADLEILGSEKSLKAHRQLTAMLSQQNPPSAEEFNAAKSQMLESLQNDIMGNNAGEDDYPDPFPPNPKDADIKGYLKNKP